MKASRFDIHSWPGFRASHLFPALFWALLTSVGLGQEGIRVEGGFRTAQYYPVPHEKQMRFLLTGSKAEQMAGGVLALTQAKLQTFQENGQPEMVVEAPQCNYEENQHSIRSPGPLQLHAADGKFSLTGEGFFWGQTNSTLFVSNRVHTIVHQDLMQPGGGATNTTVSATNGMEIFSDRFDYSEENGLGNYRQNVRTEGGDLNMTAGKLEFLLPMKQKQVERLTATENVNLNSGAIHATGQQLVYTPATDLARITGQPRWQAEGREGSGDELLVERTNRIFRVAGQAWLKMPRQSLGTNGFLPSQSVAATNASAMSNQFVEIRSTRYEFRTNSATFEEQVEVTDRAGDQVRGSLTCAHLLAIFNGTNQMQEMIASNSVVIQQDEKRFEAEHAVYHGTNGLLELTGHPTWKDGLRNGRGDVVLLDVQRNELTADGHAWLRLPAREMGAAPQASASPSTKGQGKVPLSSSIANSNTTSSATEEFAEISARKYVISPETAVFENDVHIIHPQMDMTCTTMNAELQRSGEGARQIIARDAVVFDLTDEKGQKIHGTGQKAVYTYNVSIAGTNDQVELTGKPMLVMTNGSTFSNSVIVLDRASGKLLAPGKYHIHGVAESTGTNTFGTPKSKSRKRS